MLFWLKTSCMCIKNNTLAGTGCCIKAISCFQLSYTLERWIFGVTKYAKKPCGCRARIFWKLKNIFTTSQVVFVSLSRETVQACWHIRDCELGHAWFKAPVMPNTTVLNQIQFFLLPIGSSKDVHESVSLIAQRKTQTFWSNGNATVDIKGSKFHST